MTAFGRGRAEGETKTVTVEIKSVNSRFFDCSVKMPRSYSFLEERIKNYVQKNAVSRAKVDVYITVDRHGSDLTELALDTALAENYIAVLRQLRDTFGLPDDISVMRVARREELFVKESKEIDIERLWEHILAALAPAADAFLASREAEGDRLEADIRGKLQSIREALERIKSTAACDVSRYRERLTARVREALAESGYTPDEGRLLTECAVYADRIAIDEEVVRLASHLDSFEDMAKGEGTGRKLDFLMQEMNREANTIGSKCLDAAVALEVVEIKCTLEKIREQIQNIE